METHKISYKQSFADLNNLINSVVGDSEIIAISNVEVRFKSRVLKKVFFGVLIIIGIGIFNAVIDKVLEFILEDFFSSIKDIRVVLFITLFCGLVLLIGFLAGIAKVRDIIILTEDKIFVIQGIIKYGDNRFRAKEVTSIAIGEITKCTTNPLTLFRRFFKLRTDESKIYISQSYFWSTKTSLNSKFVNLRKFLQSVKTVDKIAYNYYFVEPQYILFFKGVLKFIFILYSLGIILIPFYATWVLAKIRYDSTKLIEENKKEQYANTTFGELQKQRLLRNRGIRNNGLERGLLNKKLSNELDLPSNKCLDYVYLRYGEELIVPSKISQLRNFGIPKNSFYKRKVRCKDYKVGHTILDKNKIEAYSKKLTFFPNYSLLCLINSSTNLVQYYLYNEKLPEKSFRFTPETLVKKIKEHKGEIEVSITEKNVESYVRFMSKMAIDFTEWWSFPGKYIILDSEKDIPDSIKIKNNYYSSSITIPAIELLIRPLRFKEKYNNYFIVEATALINHSSDSKNYVVLGPLSVSDIGEIDWSEPAYYLDLEESTINIVTGPY